MVSDQIEELVMLFVRTGPAGEAGGEADGVRNVGASHVSLLMSWATFELRQGRLPQAQARAPFSARRVPRRMQRKRMHTRISMRRRSLAPPNAQVLLTRTRTLDPTSGELHHLQATVACL